MTFKIKKNPCLACKVLDFKKLSCEPQVPKYQNHTSIKNRNVNYDSLELGKARYSFLGQVPSSKILLTPLTLQNCGVFMFNLKYLVSEIANP